MQHTDLPKLIFEITGSKVMHLRQIHKGGYTAAQRWLAAMEDGRKLFIKVAVDSFTSKQLRAEYKICSEVQASFMPRVVGWFEDICPVFIREDIEGTWPPPWDQDQITGFRDLLNVLADFHPTFSLHTVEDIQHLKYWKVLSESPDSFVALQGLPKQWLKDIFPTMLDLESSATLEGDSLIHFDLRGENICFTDQAIKIIDWDHAARGNPSIDQAMWRINLCIEGGPQPWQEEFKDTPVLAALCSFFGYASSLPAPASVSREILHLQKLQFEVSLDWLIRITGLRKAPIIDNAERQRP